MPAWLLAIGGVVAVLAVFALLFVLIDFSTAQQGLELIAYGIGWVVAGIFFVLGWPLIKILEGIFWFMQWLAHLGEPHAAATARYGSAGPAAGPANAGRQHPAAAGWTRRCASVWRAGCHSR